MQTASASAHHQAAGDTKKAYQALFSYCMTCKLAAHLEASSNLDGHINWPAVRSQCREGSLPAALDLYEPVQRSFPPHAMRHFYGLRNNCMGNRLHTQYLHRTLYKRISQRRSYCSFLFLGGTKKDTWTQNGTTQPENGSPCVCVFRRDAPAPVLDVSNGRVTDPEHPRQLALCETVGGSVFFEWVCHDATHGSTSTDECNPLLHISSDT